MIQTMKPKTSAFWQILLSFILSLGIVLLVLWGGWSLGFFLAVLLVELVFLAWLCLPFAETAGLEAARPAVLPGIRKQMPLLILLAAAIVDLGFCYVLYDNMWLKVLNFPIIFGLCLVQYLLAAQVFHEGWDKPGFWLEVFLSAIARPFISLPDFGRSVARLFSRSLPPVAVSGTPESTVPATASRHPLGKILLGLLLAVPVLLISGSVLTSADPVFARLFEQISAFLSMLASQDLYYQLLTALLMLPFIFSFLYSGRSRRKMVRADGQLAQMTQSAANVFRFDKTVLITFLTCINLLYLVFAFVQLAYLTGAFTAVLPGEMTYAEYARSGFFELAGISVVNLALVVLAVKATDRHGLAGLIVRIESLLLVACSLVQWGSAMFRMDMYVNAYGQTLLRFMVTAFMLLLLVLFLLLVVKEFRAKFPLLKSFAAAMLVALLALNHVNSDAWVARHNVQRYLEQGTVDAEYFRELSSDAVPAMLQLVDSGDPKTSDLIAQQLLERYSGPLEKYSNGRWQSLNISQGRARDLLSARLEELQQLQKVLP